MGQGMADAAHDTKLFKGLYTIPTMREDTDAPKPLKTPLKRKKRG